MNNITILFPEGKEKILTFSYDDGVEQDIRLVGILNKYGLRGTFNINSHKTITPITYQKGAATITNIEAAKIAEIFKGHEIATHSHTHPRFTRIHESSIFQEIHTDRVELEKLVGYIVRGHAYPFGEYDKRTLLQLESNFISYARTTVNTEKFHFPHNYLEWHPTCHHNSPRLLELLDRFLSPKSYGSLFYVWGHSYEFDVDDNWQVIEEFCEKASGKDNVWYATNIEIYDYMQAFYSLIFSADGLTIYNPTAYEIFFRLNDKARSIKSGETLFLG